MTTLAIRALRAGAGTPIRLLRAILGRADMARSRRELRRLDDHLLRDIGLTRHEAEAEAARSRWDAPLHWRG